MKNFSAFLLSMYLLLICAHAAHAASENAHAAFVHYSGTLSVDYEIKNNSTGGDCTRIGTWDHTTKTCTLSMDLVPSGNIAWNGITAILSIGSSGIVLDGNGHSITGSYRDVEMGIYISGKHKVTVKNLTVAGCAYGIYLSEKAMHNSIQQNTIMNNMYGISITTDIKENTVSRNVVMNNSYSGIFLGYYASANTITDNTVSQSGYGIMLYGTCNDNVITNNVIDKQVFVGLESYNNIIEGNTF